MLFQKIEIDLPSCNIVNCKQENSFHDEEPNIAISNEDLVF